jgi:hypothetical protein
MNLMAFASYRHLIAVSLTVKPEFHINTIFAFKVSSYCTENTNRLMLLRESVGPTKAVRAHALWVRCRVVRYVNRAAVGYIYINRAVP